MSTGFSLFKKGTLFSLVNADKFLLSIFASFFNNFKETFFRSLNFVQIIIVISALNTWILYIKMKIFIIPPPAALGNYNWIWIERSVVEKFYWSRQYLIVFQKQFFCIWCPLQQHGLVAEPMIKKVVPPQSDWVTKFTALKIKAEFKKLYPTFERSLKKWVINSKTLRGCWNETPHLKRSSLPQHTSCVTGKTDTLVKQLLHV